MTPLEKEFGDNKFFRIKPKKYADWMGRYIGGPFAELELVSNSSASLSRFKEVGSKKCIYLRIEDVEVIPKPTSTTKPTPASALDTQVGGSHYKDMGLQPLEACYQRYGYIGAKAAIHCKVDKYLREKDNRIEDLEKAVHCLQMLVEFAKRDMAAQEEKTNAVK